MDIIATYFDEKLAGMALQALKAAGIEAVLEQQENETGTEISIRVPEEQMDPACEIVERVEGLLDRRIKSDAAKCPVCSKDLLHTRETGSFGEYDVFLCETCEKVIVNRRH